MSELGELSQAEVRLIQEHRRTAAARAEHDAFMRAAAQTFAAYHEWLSIRCRLTSYSTFVNEFGYEHQDSNRMYAVVSKLLDNLVEHT